jgi:ATP-dependent helicase HrpA
VRELRERLATVSTLDAHRIGRRLEKLRGGPDDPRRIERLAEIAADIDRAASALDERRASVPDVTYPPELPVSARRTEIAAAIRDHQVVIVAGETGSGKTTQIPKICLELGRGVRGAIGHTQPRRIAARTVAERIADELGQDVGQTVGWKVRFTDKVGTRSLVKVMTDGILLAELKNDRLLRAYDTIIIDEAHERSLNIDFLLGYLAEILPRRPDLKVVITSATIDPERFSRHFGDAPIIEVSGRTYPVEVRYRPVDDDTDRDVMTAICDAVDELAAEADGDVLVFLSGEREIRDAADALSKHLERRRRPGAPAVEILPLFARLSAADQHKVFTRSGNRRVVLATNVAETSLTVPGIRYVVDTGTARISRYSRRLKVQRLPIERVSKASADQRKGRCGRVADGICIRLYSEEDFESRPDFTDPEIQRTNLASVILQMAALGLGDVASFPFVDPPDPRAINDGLVLLTELGALDLTGGAQAGRVRLTDTGRALARLPLDPRLGRMILEADRLGCLREVLIITSALSIQDPRERPAEHQQAADQHHARFTDPTSDFLGYLNLWNHLADRQRELSSSAFRRTCKAEFLHYLRIREWQDLHAQVREAARSMGLHPAGGAAAADPDRVHQALLAGLLSHVGLKETNGREYAGARNATFMLWPGSALAKKPPRWVMAGEIVETSRLWGRDAARIDPSWIEPLADHLVLRTYGSPHWSAKRGQVVATEKVTLFGLPIVVDRMVGYDRVDAVAARDMFIRHALVEGDWKTHHRFFHDNRRLLEEAAELEDKARRRDLVVGEEDLVDFYDRRLPADVVSARHFDSWWKKARRSEPDLLTFDPTALLRDAAGDVDHEALPDSWTSGPVDLDLTYKFEPGARDDGVTVTVPIAALAGLDTTQFDWQVPGLRLELVTALIKSLPKNLRTRFVPAPDTARKVLDQLSPDDGPITEALSRALTRLSGVRVPRDAWDLSKVPGHLRPTFTVVDEDGSVLATGKDLEVLRSRLADEVRATVVSAAAGIERTGLTSWSFGTLPRTIERTLGEHVVTAYPTLVDTGTTVDLRVLADPIEQRRSMRRGVRRLLLIAAPPSYAPVVQGLSTSAKLSLGQSPYPSVPDLLADCAAAVVDEIAGLTGPEPDLPWDEAAFDALVRSVRAELPDRLPTAVRTVSEILATARESSVALDALTQPVLSAPVQDIRRQLDRLVGPGFVSATGHARLPDLRRYLRAVSMRVEKLPTDHRKDAERAEIVGRVEQEWADFLDEVGPARVDDADVVAIRWMIEELRVSLFAQTLRTPYPVSEKRIYAAMDAAVA